MSWKIITLQSLILLGLSYLTIQYFSIDLLSEVRFEQQKATNEISSIKKHIEHLDRQIKQLINTKNESRTAPAVKHAAIKDKAELLLSQRISALEQREQDLTETISSLVALQEDIYQQEQAPPEQTNVQGWLTTLPDEKKAMVKEIYQEQLAIMQNSIPMSPGQMPPSSEEMLSILQENRSELKTRLQEILTEEEYESFLETLNRSQHPPGLPISAHPF